MHTMKRDGYYTVNNTKIARYTIKSKLPDVVILFIHGFATNSLINSPWYSYVHNLLEVSDYRVDSYAIDLKGHGKSEGPIHTASDSEHVQVVAQVQKEIQENYTTFNPNFVAVGHSMGGMILLHTASKMKKWSYVTIAPSFRTSFRFINWIPNSLFRLFDKLIHSVLPYNIVIDSGICPANIYSNEKIELYDINANAWKSLHGDRILISLADAFSISFMWKMINVHFPSTCVRIILFTNDQLVDNCLIKSWASDNNIQCEQQKVLMKTLHCSLKTKHVLNCLFTKLLPAP